MSLEKFIRIDEKGHWKGTEHKSSMNGMAGEWDEEIGTSSFERGISCYSLTNKAEGINNLREYWYEIAMFKSPKRFEGMQVTIFEGEKIGTGSDYEDVATCETTLLELDAVEFMDKVFTAFEQLEEEEISEEEYHKILENIFTFEKLEVKNMKNLQEVLNGWCTFNGWSSYQREPKVFSNKLNEFGTFKVYNNFTEFLKDNDHFLVDDDGNELDVNRIISNEEEFTSFLENQLNPSPLFTLSFECINEPFLFGRADSSDPNEYFELVSNMKNEKDVLLFVNKVLTDCGEVSHASGRKNQYEVVSIETF